MNFNDYNKWEIKTCDTKQVQQETDITRHLSAVDKCVFLDNLSLNNYNYKFNDFVYVQQTTVMYYE